MGIIDSVFGKKSKDSQLTKWREKAAEKEAYQAEVSRRKLAKEAAGLERARARGKAKATPIYERVGSVASSAEKILKSDSFQGIARGASGWSLSTPKRSGGKKSKKSRTSRSRRGNDFDFSWI